MKINKNTNLPLDKFIEFALYDKDAGYYMKKNPFGKEGDFITAPNITRLFSEMIAIWIVTFWKSIGSPKKFNLFELGAGNGEMIKVIVETLKNFPECFENCKFYIHEKSKLLTKQQQINLSSENIEWVDNIKEINSEIISLSKKEKNYILGTFIFQFFIFSELKLLCCCFVNNLLFS